MDERKLAERGAWTSLIAYGILAAIKLAVGFFAVSSSLTADGFNNLTDLVSSAAILVGLRISGKPRDEDHPYGHSRAETVATLVASFIMVTIGIQVLRTSLTSLFSDDVAPSPEIWAVWTGALAAVTMFSVYRYNRSLAKRINSLAVEALAKDNFSDALVSVGAVIGIVGARLGRPWLDPFVALIIGGVICRTAWGIFRKASHIVTDGFDPPTLDEYRQTVLDVDGVAAVTDMKARFQGNDVVVDVTVEVHPELNVVDSHDIADEIEYRMRRRHDVETTHVHVEPHVEG